MILRVARHTTDLDRIAAFYTGLLGLQKLGEFQSHDGYDGLFLGKTGSDWHLEFTISSETPDHQPDEDDLLVFYVDSEEVLKELQDQFSNAGYQPETAKNPYWNSRGLTYTDPDGFKIVISVSRK
jgi:catechol 2,3-dioxygenase-like lactoylglutathione lyase family enzyme